MIRNKYAILGMTFVSLGLLGALISAIGASLPLIQKFFTASIGQTGYVTVLYQLSYALFCFFGGFLTDFFGKNRVLSMGGILYGLCTLTFGLTSNFNVMLALFSLVGIGGGLLFIGANTMIVQLFPENRGKYLNLLHLCFAIGSVLASLLVSSFVVSGFRWDRVFQLLGIIAIGSGTFFLFTNAGAPSSTFDAATLKGLLKKYKQLLGEKKFISLLVANTLAIGTQFGTIYLLVLFLTSTRGLPQARASLVLAAYFVLLGTGRIVCSSLITRYPITRIVTFLLVLLFSSLLVGWLTRGSFSIICFAITGLASSGLMPSLLALASHMLPKEVTGLALGVLSMFGGLGGMGLMKLVTWMAGYTGLNTAFLAVVFVSLVALIYFLGISGRYRVFEEGKK
jgi:MFS family permease